PINVQIVQAIKIDKLDFYRVCLQFEPTIFVGSFFVENNYVDVFFCTNHRALRLRILSAS
ncbi:hypothetical protein ABWK46_21680, partial [Peribacillus frigoritolerans]|uniref:hypothetical protein n=1 Tax=Peribacillus frigoritolerans TaxID=450367 RepID=UPI0033951D26